MSAEKKAQAYLLEEDKDKNRICMSVVNGSSVPGFAVGGEKRVCFIQLLCVVFYFVDMDSIRVALDKLKAHIYPCSERQLKLLKEACYVPSTVKSCGLICETYAHKLCGLLIHDKLEPSADLSRTERYSILIKHRIFSGAVGRLYYNLYKSAREWSLQCADCFKFFPPSAFVSHSCKQGKGDNTIHWGFEPEKWRHYLYVKKGQDNYEWFKELFENYKKEYGTRTSSDGVTASSAVKTSDKREEYFALDNEQPLDMRKESLLRKSLEGPLPYERKPKSCPFSPPSTSLSQNSERPSVCNVLQKPAPQFGNVENYTKSFGNLGAHRMLSPFDHIPVYSGYPPCDCHAGIPSCRGSACKITGHRQPGPLFRREFPLWNHGPSVMESTSRGASSHQSECCGKQYVRANHDSLHEMALMPSIFHPCQIRLASPPPPPLPNVIYPNLPGMLRNLSVTGHRANRARANGNRDMERLAASFPMSEAFANPRMEVPYKNPLGLGSSGNHLRIGSSGGANYSRYGMPANRAGNLNYSGFRLGDPGSNNKPTQHQPGLSHENAKRKYRKRKHP